MNQDGSAATLERLAKSRSGSTESRALTIKQPDMDSWSATRIRAYEAAAHGDPLPEAILSIGALGIEVPVYAGASEWNLNRGAARIAGTAPFGVTGNSGIAAHRDGYFRALQDIRRGQRIEIETLGERLRYRVTDIQIVAPEAVEVLEPTQHESLTLVTCFPFYHVGPAPQRFIVRAERIEPGRFEPGAHI